MRVSFVSMLSIGTLVVLAPIFTGAIDFMSADPVIAPSKREKAITLLNQLERVSNMPDGNKRRKLSDDCSDRLSENVVEDAEDENLESMDKVMRRLDAGNYYDAIALYRKYDAIEGPLQRDDIYDVCQVDAGILASEAAAIAAVLRKQLEENVEPFDFASATRGEKVVFFEQAGEDKAAIRHFHDADKSERTKKVVAAYKRVMKRFVAVPSDTPWEDIVDDPVMMVRAYWTKGMWDKVMTECHNGNEEIWGDDQATAAYMDADLRH